MKKNKILKTLGLFGCAVLLVAVSIAGTLAFMTDSKTVTNTFTIGKVAITMDEAKVDQYGVAADPAARVTENTYKLIPNHTYVKDPTIHVDAASEDCYVFFKVENNLGSDVALNIDTTKWTQIGTSGVYYYNTVSKSTDADRNYVAFTQFTVADTVDADKLTELNGKTVVVTGYAVQADGFADADGVPGAVHAWNATFGKPANP